MQPRTGPRGIGMLAAGLGMALALGWSPAQAQEEEEREARRHRHVEVHPRVMASTMGGGYLGVQLEDVEEEDVGELGLPEERGARVVDVAGDTPAERAGLREGDVIVAWNGSALESVAELQRHVRETPAGRTVRLGIVRDGDRREVEVELGDRSEAMAFHFGPDAEWRTDLEERMGDLREHLRGMERGDFRMRGGPRMMFFGHSRMGVGLQSLGEQLGEYFGLGERSGALVTHVEEDSPAAAAGLRAGDVILSIDGEDVEDPGDARRIVRRAEAGPVEVRVLRDGSERSVTVELEELEERDEGEGWGWRGGPDAVPAPAIRIRAAPVQVRVGGAPFGGLARAPVAHWVPGFSPRAPVAAPAPMVAEAFLAPFAVPAPTPEVDVYY